MGVILPRPKMPEKRFAQDYFLVGEIIGNMEMRNFVQP